MTGEEPAGVEIAFRNEVQQHCAPVDNRLQVQLKGMPIHEEDWVTLVVGISGRCVKPGGKRFARSVIAVSKSRQVTDRVALEVEDYVPMPFQIAGEWLHLLSGLCSLERAEALAPGGISP
jgi:hypothetical protein